MTDSDRTFPPLHLAAFDHRSSLDKALSALDGPDDRILDRLAAKHLIWAGIQRTLDVTDHAAVLTDADAGSVLDAAKQAGTTTAMALERSGQRWLEPERDAAETRQLLQRYRPDYAKLLVRWHPSDPNDRRQAQIDTIHALADIAEQEGSRLMLELLITADGDDAALNRVDPDVFHDEVLPVRLADSIRQLSDSDVVPAMWKVDGLPRRDACAHVAAAVHAGSDGAAGIVILGAGKDLAAVRGWFAATEPHANFCGFAIGRTIWWDAVAGYVRGEMTHDESAELIGTRFAEVVAAYNEATHASTVTEN